jgi:regulator of protease activity HflC (stomatin/prohibitin superfamily)
VLGFVRVLREYERAVFFRWGRLLDPPRGPGLVWKIPIVDQIVKVDLRTIKILIASFLVIL